MEKVKNVLNIGVSVLIVCSSPKRDFIRKKMVFLSLSEAPTIRIFACKVIAPREVGKAGLNVYKVFNPSPNKGGVSVMLYLFVSCLEE